MTNRSQEEEQRRREAAGRIDAVMRERAQAGDRAFADAIALRAGQSQAASGSDGAIGQVGSDGAIGQVGSDGSAASSGAEVAGQTPPTQPANFASRSRSRRFRMRPLTWVLLLAAVAFIALGVVYFVTPAGDLPAFVPGHIAGSGVHHFKHGLAAMSLAVVALIGAWFTTRP